MTFQPFYTTCNFNGKIKNENFKILWNFYFYSQSIHLLSVDEGTGFTYHTCAYVL